MSAYNYDQDPYDYDDDERFYEETAYNEEYYIERERVLIRQSNLDLELEELEERHIREMREEGLIDEFTRLQGLDAAFQFDLRDLLMILITVLIIVFWRAWKRAGRWPYR